MNKKNQNFSGKVHVKSQDTVFVISGKDRGKVGKVLRVMPKSGKIVVDGVNLRTKHMKKSERNEGGKVTFAAPIFSSKVMLYSEATGTKSRVYKKFLEDGSKVRYIKKTDEIV